MVLFGHLAHPEDRAKMILVPDIAAYVDIDVGLSIRQEKWVEGEHVGTRTRVYGEPFDLPW